MLKHVLFSLVVLFLTVGGIGAQATPRHKIGLVFDASGRGDKSFNDSAYEGLLEVAQNFRGYFVDDPSAPRHGNEVSLKYLVPRDNSLPERLRVLRQLAREGYRLIFAVGFAYTEAVTQVAPEFPSTQFVLIDGFIPNLRPEDNITVVLFNEHEGSFLIGMLAGLMNEGGKIGFIGGMEVPVIHRFEAGFRAGAMYINPQLRRPGQILIQYLGSDPASAFNNPERAYQVARQMYRQGATIIYHAAGGSGMGLFRAAAEARKWAIGVDADQGAVLSADTNPALREQAPWILTSMLKRVNRPVLLISRDFIRTGRIPQRYQNFGLNFDAVSFALNDLNRGKIPPEVAQRLSDARFQIRNGQITVPSSREQLETWVSR